MPNCNNCGAFVTRDFVRVFGTNDDEVFACVSCTTMADIVEGAARERPATAPAR